MISTKEKPTLDGYLEIIEIILINLISIIMLVVCLELCVVLVLISNSKSNVEISEKSVDELPQNYTSTEDTSSTNTWNISATEKDNVRATLSDDGLLTIFGTGNMKDWNTDSTTEWHGMSDKVTTVVIETGVTNTGKCVFFDCYNLTSIKFNGTIAQWQAITKHSYWNDGIPATEVVCKDGTVEL